MSYSFAKVSELLKNSTTSSLLRYVVFSTLSSTTRCACPATPTSTASTADAAPARFAFVNCWRNIDRDAPVLADPLCCCTWPSVNLKEDAWPYLMMYPDRVGENLALCNEGADSHAWYHYSKMTCDEALYFKVYDSSEAEGVPRFVFHSAFKDPRTPKDAPPRQSIELRTIAIWDD